MGPAISTLEKETDEMIELEDETNKRFVALEHEIRNNNALQCVQEPVMARRVESLKEWTGKAGVTIVYDSKIDPFTHDGLFSNLRGKENIAIIGFTTDGDVFGGFYSVAVTKQDKKYNDPDMFIFSFESHGRCETPQRFDVKKGEKGEAVVGLFKNHPDGFVQFWVANGHFWLGNEKSKSDFWNISLGFEGVEDTTLTGKSGLGSKDEHHCARLVAVQLE